MLPPLSVGRSLSGQERLHVPQGQRSEYGGLVAEMQALQRDYMAHQLLSVQSPLSTLPTI